MGEIIAIAIIAVIVGGAIFYVIKAKNVSAALTGVRVTVLAAARVV